MHTTKGSAVSLLNSRLTDCSDEGEFGGLRILQIHFLVMVENTSKYPRTGLQNGILANERASDFAYLY